MNMKLPQQDKEFLRAKYKNKVWDLGYYLLANGVRGDDFEYIMQDGENVNCTSKKQRQQWLAGAMNRLDERIPAAKVKEIRERSACCLTGERHKVAKEIHDSYSTVDERFEAFSKAHVIIGDTAVKTGENTYRICFWENPPEGGKCFCLGYIPKEPMPMSWCACCGGHIRHHFETALGVKAECRCISSQLSSCGKEKCVFELRVTEVL